METIKFKDFLNKSYLVPTITEEEIQIYNFAKALTLFTMVAFLFFKFAPMFLYLISDTLLKTALPLVNPF